MIQAASGAQTLDQPLLAIPALAGYKVILHRDDYHQIPYVVSSLLKVIAVLKQGEAESIAVEALRKTGRTKATGLVAAARKHLA